MPGVQQKYKLMKLWELLKRETDEDHPISRMELCRRLNEMGISSNVRTLSLDIEELTVGGYEIISRKQGKEKVYFVADHEFSIPEIKIIIDALQAAASSPKRRRPSWWKRLPRSAACIMRSYLNRAWCASTRASTRTKPSSILSRLHRHEEGWNGLGYRDEGRRAFRPQ